MALTILRGPAGSGKSQHIAEADPAPQVIADYTRLWAAITGAERGPDGRYPERRDDDPTLALVASVQAHVVRVAQREGLRGYVTTSDSRPEAVERLRELGATAGVETLDPGEEVVRNRLRDRRTGRLSRSCDKAVRRWYRPRGVFRGGGRRR